MFYRATQIIAVVALATAMMNSPDKGIDETPIIKEATAIKTNETQNHKSEATKVVEFKTLVQSSGTIIEEPDYGLTDEEIELIALVTMAEAEGESELGKRLVIDTILNRVDSELRYMPDTVYDVVYQKNAFSSMWGARVEKVEATDEVIELVKEELLSRTNYDVLWFRTKHYPKYGEPITVEGGHYFSGFKGGANNE